jgi:hypothetical protein
MSIGRSRLKWLEADLAPFRLPIWKADIFRPTIN